MKLRKKVLYVFGTRPEALKLAPLIQASRRDSNFRTYVCTTGQHREMADQVMRLFRISADYDLKLMTKGQTLHLLTELILKNLPPVLAHCSPDLVVVQGDTTTAFAAALAAFYAKIPVAHIEAGLRSRNKFHPFPEEINRSLISRIADLHLAPTKEAAGNLLKEGIQRDQIFITGNTVVDALQSIRKTLGTNKGSKTQAGRKIILVTAHRRENFGAPLISVCRALIRLVKNHPDIEIVYPAHLNPQVQTIVNRLLKGMERISLLPPLDYAQFMQLMVNSHIILTDSGGIQEEAPSLRKPVLVMRETSERPEGIKLGVARLVGTSEMKIYNETSRLLRDTRAYLAMSKKKNPYGDGKASKRILKCFASFLNSHSKINRRDA